MWGYKTIWYGRRAGNYKCQLQKLQEDEMLTSDSNKDKPSGNEGLKRIFQWATKNRITFEDPFKRFY